LFVSIASILPTELIATVVLGFVTNWLYVPLVVEAVNDVTGFISTLPFGASSTTLAGAAAASELAIPLVP
jgi:hypothetical protein